MVQTNPLAAQASDLYTLVTHILPGEASNGWNRTNARRVDRTFGIVEKVDIELLGALLAGGGRLAGE